jgi:hypothetical protein
LRQAGDSIVRLEYTSTNDGQFQYRRVAATPILHVAATGARLIDAAPLGKKLRLLRNPEYEILRLPDSAMRPRLYDPRLTLPNTTFNDGKATKPYYTLRWRLEKRDRLPHIGPYDRWAIAWGYRPIPQAHTPEAELPALERWRSIQDTTLYLQPSIGDFDTWDPWATILTGGDDPFKSREYGLRYLLRLAAVLEPGQDTVAHPSHGFIAKRWDRLLDLVASLVGGAAPRAPYHADLGKITLVPVDSARHIQAIRAVIARMFYGQDELASR